MISRYNYRDIMMYVHTTSNLMLSDGKVLLIKVKHYTHQAGARPPCTYTRPHHHPDYTTAITPPAVYLHDLLNVYTNIGLQGPFVLLLGPPLGLAPGVLAICAAAAGPTPAAVCTRGKRARMCDLTREGDNGNAMHSLSRAALAPLPRECMPLLPLHADGIHWVVPHRYSLDESMQSPLATTAAPRLRRT